MLRDNRILSEMALRCGDVGWKDFHKDIYERCFLRASRRTARRYQILQRVYSFNSVIPVKETEDSTEVLERERQKPIVLPLISFIAEYRISVNDVLYDKAELPEADKQQYALWRSHNQILFNYTPRTLNDEVIIHYTSDINEEDYDIEEIEPIIPSQYEEEVIGIGITELAKLGIAKYAGSERAEKYKEVLRLYSIDENSLDKDLLKNSNWIQMKAHWGC